MKTIAASAPGSVMIIGEHAVVYGYPAIVAAVAQRIEVRLKKNDVGLVRIQSALGHYEAQAGFLKPDRRLAFVLACLERYPSAGGLDLEIKSKIDPTLGLGSSAAVTVAMLGALARATGYPEDKEMLHRQALTIIRSLQGRGSGADLAASLCGGLVGYRNLPEVEMTPLPAPPAALFLAYAGYKTPTAEVLAMIAGKMAEHPTRYEALYQTMGTDAEAAVVAVQEGRWSVFYATLKRYQHWMRALGVSDEQLERLIANAQSAYAAKISGSGLGDCVLAFAQHAPEGFVPAPLDFSGLVIDEEMCF